MLRVELDPSAESDTARIDVEFIDIDGTVLTEWLDVLITTTNKPQEAIAVAEPENEFYQYSMPNQAEILAAAGARGVAGRRGAACAAVHRESPGGFGSAEAGDERGQSSGVPGAAGRGGRRG